MAFESSNDWQSTKNTVSERNAHMFDNSFMSDITLTCEGSTRVFYAHKYVLATSSAVFYAMFYGDLAEKDSNLHLPDTDEESLQEFLRFLYTDDNTMTWRVALKVMYLSAKYVIPSMTKKCCEVLKEQVYPGNVFAVLKQAVLFNQTELQDKSWKALDMETTESLNSEDFDDISPDTLNSLLQRESLTSEEVDLFQAVLRWSGKQCLKKGLEATGKNRRAMLGDAIYNIHFLTMSKEEFSDHVLTSGLLTTEESSCILQQIDGGVVHDPKWTQHDPRPRAGLLQFSRFHDSCIDVNLLEWDYKETEWDELSFMVNKPVWFHGVRLFGDPAGSYSTYMHFLCAETKEADETEGIFVPEKDRNGIGGYDVMFEEITMLEANKKIVMSARISGPPSNHGQNGEISVQCNDIVVTFSNAENTVFDGYTNSSRGQFQKIYLSPA